MLPLRSLLLLALCLSVREALEESVHGGGGGEDEDSRTPSLDSSSNSSQWTISSQTPAVTRGDAGGIGSERTSDSTDSLPCSQTTCSPRTDALQTPSDSLTGAPGGDSSGPKLLDAADTWTEPVHLRAEEVSVLELGTEATMPSEDLPLIFEDVASPSVVSVTVAPAAVTTGDTERTVSMDTVHTSSDVLLSGTLDWQTSGARASVTEPDASLERNDDITQSSVTHQTLAAVHEDLESKEEPDEDEEESEEESEEDLMESTLAPHARPPYSLIPPPPVWVQRNQGLVRSWVELIREKAGYVSGMLAPVGIGIAGALLLVGALYSIRLIHRKRRDSFKHQRRKPPREVRSSPDNAMLLADSSEDEF